MKTDRELLELAASVPTMTLRDYFAVSVLPKMSGWYAPEQAALGAYAYADAMLKARAAVIGEGME